MSGEQARRGEGPVRPHLSVPSESLLERSDLARPNRASATSSSWTGRRARPVASGKGRSTHGRGTGGVGRPRLRRSREASDEREEHAEDEVHLDEVRGGSGLELELKLGLERARSVRRCGWEWRGRGRGLHWARFSRARS